MPQKKTTKCHAFRGKFDTLILPESYRLQYNTLTTSPITSPSLPRNAAHSLYTPGTQAKKRINYPVTPSVLHLQANPRKGKRSFTLYRIETKHGRRRIEMEIRPRMSVTNAKCYWGGVRGYLGYNQYLITCTFYPSGLWEGWMVGRGIDYLGSSRLPR